MKTLTYSARITNPNGLHMRPATAFAAAALRFKSEVTVRCASLNKVANGKSPLDMMFLAAPEGSELTVEVVGDDAPEALEALAAVLLAANEEPATTPDS